MGVIININELKQSLEYHAIPIDSYSLTGGLPNEAFCILGYGDSWEVYYSEKGQKSGLLVFNSENDACENMFQRIISSHLGA